MTFALDVDYGGALFDHSLYASFENALQRFRASVTRSPFKTHLAWMDIY